MSRAVLSAALFLASSFLLSSSAWAKVEPVAVIVPGESGEEWPGGETDTEVHAVGKASIRWRHADASHLSLANCPADWTAASAIRFRIHNAVVTGSSFMILFVSDDPKTEGMDYWMHRVVLDFTGWREIVVSRRGLGAARSPLGWNQIQRVDLAATGWDQKLDPKAVVNIDQVELVEMTGPRTSDQELFAALDLEGPELAAVRTLVAAEDWPRAVAQLAAYYRARRTVPWRFDPHQIDRSVRYSKDGAENTVAGRMREIHIDHEFPNGEIDWFYNPTLVRDDLPRNNEWQWQLGRMGYWGNLGRAYWATGDERYAQAFVRQLRSWGKHCMRPNGAGNGAGSPWRTIECGIRMAYSWPDAYHRFLLSPSFTDEDLVLYLKIAYEHTLHLVAHKTTGNWLTMEMNGLYTVGAVFPEFRAAPEWRKLAADLLYKELDTQFLPDGAQIELTTGYHQVALDNVLGIPKTAKLVGRMDELPEGYVARAERAYGFNMKMMTPEGDLPHTNDAWHVNVPGTLRNALRLFPQRADFQWVSTRGEEGTAPDFVSVLLPYAGYAVMRSGWDREANYLMFDGGLLGYGHVHQDKLQVVVHAYGREMLYDGGGGNYESSKWRRYSTDTFSHNTVLVDGLPQRRNTRDRWANVAKEPLPIVWQSGGIFDYAAATYDEPYGTPDNRPATHRRDVLFLKPDLFLVVDHLAPTDEKSHRYEARWHMTSTCVKESTTVGSFASADEGKPNLAVVPLCTEGLTASAVSAQVEPELLGWLVHKTSKHIPTTTIRNSIEGAGPKRLVTLLVPLRPGQECPVRAVRAEGGKLVVDMGERALQVQADDGRLEVRETGADGRALRLASVGE